MLEELSKYHKDWLNIAYNFLNSKQDAEDVVQDMYIKVHRYGIELDKVRYKDGINKGYFHQVIRNMCLDLIKQRNDSVCIDNVNIADEDKDKSLEALQMLFDRIDEEVQTWGPYESDIFEIYMYSGLSLRDISKIKDTSVKNLFITIKQCKQRLKDKFSEDFEDYFNNDFDYL